MPPGRRLTLGAAVHRPALRPVRAAAVAAVVVVPLLAGCSGPAGSAAPTAPVGSAAADRSGPLALTSPDLAADGTLPAWGAGRYSTTCDGDNRSPELVWQGGPAAASYLLTLTDPAHPQYVHWVVTGIPGDAGGVARTDEGAVDVGVVGRSYRGDGLYAGPCVPGNTYVYTLYALDVELTGDSSTTLQDALARADGHVLDEATLDVVPVAG